MKFCCTLSNMRTIGPTLIDTFWYLRNGLEKILKGTAFLLRGFFGTVTIIQQIFFCIDF